MEIVTVLVVTIIIGLLSIMAFYYSFTKKVEVFYEEMNESADGIGTLLIVRWNLMGLHIFFRIKRKRSARIISRTSF